MCSHLSLQGGRSGATTGSFRICRIYSPEENLSVKDASRSMQRSTKCSLEIEHRSEVQIGISVFATCTDRAAGLYRRSGHSFVLPFSDAFRDWSIAFIR